MRHLTIYISVNIASYNPKPELYTKGMADIILL